MKAMEDLTSDFMRGLKERAAKHDAWLKTPEGIERQRVIQAELAVEAKREEEKKKRAVIEHFEGTGTPRRIREMLDDGLNESRALTRVREWHGARPDEAWCLVLSADKGAGKSVAAGWWLKTLNAGHYKPRFDGEVYRRWYTGTELAVMDWYGGKFADVSEMDGPLVIDDLGSEFNDVKGFFQQRLDSLIDARYREYRPTLITTNLSAADFSKRYGQRVVDRIREGGAFYEFSSTSMRGKR